MTCSVGRGVSAPISVMQPSSMRSETSFRRAALASPVQTWEASRIRMPGACDMSEGRCQRLLSLDREPVDQAVELLLVVGSCRMQCAAVVPDQQVARTPLVDVVEVLDREVEQALDQCQALVGGHALDADAVVE